MTTTDTTSRNSNPGTPVEMVRKVYARDLREKDRVNTVFRVSRKSRQTARSGKAFLVVGLEDKTGEIDARVFDQLEALDAAFNAGDYVLVEGHVIAFHGQPQVVIERVDKLDPEPIDPAEFTPRPAAPGEKAERAERGPDEGRGAAPAGGVAQLRELAERLGDPNLRALVLLFLDDPETLDTLKVAPAARGVHHAYKGGLVDHILSVTKLVHRLCDHFPQVDRDLAVAGSLLHDIGKVRELSRERNWEYTDEGRLVGHLVMTAQRIHDRASKMVGFPPLLAQHLTHIVLSHHGTPEWGSARVPMTLEAYVVHMADTLDSRMAAYLEAINREAGSENWTEHLKLHDRTLWRGPLPTARGKSPGEGGGRRRDKKKGPRKDGPKPEGAREAREPREAKEAREAKEPAPKLAFPPLAKLAGGAEAAPATPAAEESAPPAAEPAAPPDLSPTPSGEDVGSPS